MATWRRPANSRSTSMRLSAELGSSMRRATSHPAAVEQARHAFSPASGITPNDAWKHKARDHATDLAQTTDGVGGGGGSGNDRAQRVTPRSLVGSTRQNAFRPG